MSQFRDTFTKEEQREPLLDYDDSAFLFYLCTVGFCTLAPWTFISVRRLLSPHRRLARLYPQKTRSGAVLLHCRCSLCNEKRAAEQQQQQPSSSRLLHALCHFFSFRRRCSEAAKSPAGGGREAGALPSLLLLSSNSSRSSGKGNSSNSNSSSSGSAAPAAPSSGGGTTKKKQQQQQQQYTEATGKGDTHDEEERRSAVAAAAADAAASPGCSAAAAGGGGSGGRRLGSPAVVAGGSSNATAAGSSSSSPVRKRFKPRGTNWWEILEKLLLFLGWVGLATLCYNLPEMKNLKTFDPFEILELQVGASSRDVKKAYRLMSLRYHPDRNANDPTSAAKFILVSKAYQTLTDPTAKANYEKYGNPDGPRNMKVGMGLPRFLVEEKYQLLVLACFFLFLLVLLPMAFICYYQRQKKYAPNGVLVETLQFLTHYLTEGSRLKNCPEYLAASGESRAYKIEKADDKEMQPIIENAVEPKKRALNNPVIVRWW